MEKAQDVILNASLYTQNLRNGTFRYYTKGPNASSLVDTNGNPTVPAADIGTINLTTVDPTRPGVRDADRRTDQASVRSR